MATRHEAIVTALVTALAAHSAQVMREEVLPQHCPAAGLLNILPADPVERGVRLGHGTREWQRDVELELVVQGAEGAARSAALDEGLIQIGLLLFGTSLGGLVDHLELGPPMDSDDIPMEGAGALKGAIVRIALFYETSANPMEIQS